MTDEEYIKMSIRCSDNKEEPIEERKDKDEPSSLEVSIYAIIIGFALLYLGFMR